LELQLKDNVRARKLDVKLQNKFISGRSKKVRIDSQQALYEHYLKESQQANGSI
jgi:polyphosphate kinase